MTDKNRRKLQAKRARNFWTCARPVTQIVPNKNFNYHVERPWTTTIIPDFKGTIQIEVVRETGTFQEDSEYWKAGETWEDYLVHVVGHGVNKKTGKAINFISKQTSL